MCTCPLFNIKHDLILNNIIIIYNKNYLFNIKYTTLEFIKVLKSCIINFLAMIYNSEKCWQNDKVKNFNFNIPYFRYFLDFGTIYQEQSLIKTVYLNIPSVCSIVLNYD